MSASGHPARSDAPAGARAVRHLPPPRGLPGHLRAARWTLLRTATRLSVIALFAGTAHLGWTLGGAPLLAGNLSAAQVAGRVPLADPFAVAQLLAAGHALAFDALAGAALVLLAYALLSGRVFCGWVCPMGLVTDAADALRRRVGLTGSAARVPASTRQVVLAVALLLSVVSGVAAFEWVSPIGLLQRELVRGAGLGLGAAAGVFALDFAVLRHGWCGHLCPLGAFWSLAGRISPLRLAAVRFDDARCTRCGDCVRVCPEPQVLHFASAARTGQVAAGDCTRCGRCIAICPEASLRFGPAAAPLPVLPSAASRSPR